MRLHRVLVSLLCAAILASCGESDQDKFRNWQRPLLADGGAEKIRMELYDIRAKLEGNAPNDQKLDDIHNAGYSIEKYVDAHVLAPPPHFSTDEIRGLAMDYYRASNAHREKLYKLAKDFIYFSNNQGGSRLIEVDAADANESESSLKEKKLRLIGALKISDPGEFTT